MQDRIHLVYSVITYHLRFLHMMYPISWLVEGIS